jgi:hypothetical protein
MYAVVEERQLMLVPMPRPLRLAVGPAVTIGSSPVPFLQKVLVFALQLVIEYDAPDAPTGGSEALLRTTERAINLGVVGQLPWLSEAGKEGLARLPITPQPIGLEQVSTSAREDDGITIPAFERDPLDKPKFLEISKVISRGARFAFAVEHMAQIIRVHDTKRPNRRERLALREAQLIGSFALSNPFALRATRQVDMAAEAAPAVMVADVGAITAASRSAIALECVVPAAPVVVPRVVTIDHGRSQSYGAVVSGSASPTA